jgi:hypothetical protein
MQLIIPPALPLRCPNPADLDAVPAYRDENVGTPENVGNDQRPEGEPGETFERVRNIGKGKTADDLFALVPLQAEPIDPPSNWSDSSRFIANKLRDASLI